jgi:hypothetical protein
LIILFVPLGALVYFYVVKLADGRSAPLGLANAPQASLDQLRRQARETPSFKNRFALAEALEERQEYAEASQIYRGLLAEQGTDKQVLHGLARCLLGLDRPRDACEPLSELMEIDSTFRDYTAALDYAEALWQSGQHEDAIGLLRGLVSVVPRINHRVALAHYLSLREGPEPAREQIELALTEYEDSPDFIKRRDRNWAGRARDMLGKLRVG